jgi:hypothetical protein
VGQIGVSKARHIRYTRVMLNAARTMTVLRTLALLLAAQIHATPKQAKEPKDFPNRQNLFFLLIFVEK